MLRGAAWVSALASPGGPSEARLPPSLLLLSLNFLNATGGTDGRDQQRGVKYKSFTSLLAAPIPAGCPRGLDFERLALRGDVVILK